MMEPHEEAWRLDRVGYLTASSAHAVCERGMKGQKLKAYGDMLAQVLAERVTGLPTPSYPTQAMQWGIEHEDEAATAYEALTGNLLSGDGKTFVRHPTVAFFGCSPDRYVGDEGLVEIKCPNTLTHLDRLKTREIPRMYQTQMQVQLLCTGRKWVDFVDYDPRVKDFNPRAALLVLRYEPSATELQETLARCEEFLNEVKAAYDLLKTYGG